MGITRLMVFSILIVSIFVFPLISQEDITSEDDITRMLYEDDVSYEDYIIILEIYREKVDINGSDVSRLSELPWISNLDINEIIELRQKNGNYFQSIADFENLYGDDFSRISSFITLLPPNLKLYNLKLKLYNRNRLSESAYDPYTTSKASFRAENFGFDISAREEDFESLYIRSRSAYYNHGKHQFKIGTFRETMGTGLVFGKYLYISKSLRETSPINSFVTPADGYNNGLYWAMDGQIKSKLALTINDYDLIRVSAYAGQIGYMLNEETEIGGVISMASVDDKIETYNQTNFSLYTMGKLKTWRYALEAAYSESPGANILLRYSEDGLALKLSMWTYGKDFQPLYSEGLADKNKASSDLTSALTFSSAQRAETGGKFDIRIPLNDMFKLRLWNSYWQNTDINEHGSYISGTLYAVDFWGQSRANIGYTYESSPVDGKDNTKETFTGSITKDIDESQYKYYFNFRNYTTVEQLLDYQYDEFEDDFLLIAETDADRSLRLSTYISQQFTVTDWLDIKLRQKIYDPDINNGGDGYFEFSLIEDIDIQDINLKIEGRMKAYFDEEDDNIWELRINLGMGLGFEQVIRDK